MQNRRATYRVGLHPLYLPFYDALCKELPPEWQPYCGLRGSDEQEVDFAKGVSRAHAWESPHQYGCASDWTIWGADGKPLWLPRTDGRWSEYLQACGKVGVTPGANWGDFYHNEYAVSVHWTQVKVVYDAYGLDAAMQFIHQMHPV